MQASRQVKRKWRLCKRDLQLVIGGIQGISEARIDQVLHHAIEHAAIVDGKTSRPYRVQAHERTEQDGTEQE